jgi:hypothetical protein
MSEHTHEKPSELSDDELEEELTIAATSDDEDAEREGRFDDLLEERRQRSEDA